MAYMCQVKFFSKIIVYDLTTVVVSLKNHDTLYLGGLVLDKNMPLFINLDAPISRNTKIALQDLHYISSFYLG